MYLQKIQGRLQASLNITAFKFCKNIKATMKKTCEPNDYTNLLYYFYKMACYLAFTPFGFRRTENGHLKIYKNRSQMVSKF